MLETKLAGRYKILEYLGEGGFGQTFLAADEQLPEFPKCVVKKLKPLSVKMLPTARKLFDREARCLQSLGKHEQIPQLLAYFEQDQEFYLVEEYIEGNSLTEELKDGQQWSETDVVSFLQEILLILQFIHSQNVIHRDIKPSNIIRRKQDKKLVLIDFGAVKQLNNTESTVQENSYHTIGISTEGYTPNEQLRGYPTFSSDIYALGMTAIQALTGLSPSEFSREFDPATDQIKWRQYRSISEPLALILDKMSCPDWRKRYHSADEILSDLGSVLAKANQVSQTETRQSVPDSTFVSVDPSESTSSSVESPQKEQSRRLPGQMWRRFANLRLALLTLTIFAIGLGMIELIRPTIRPLYLIHQGNELLDLNQPQEALDNFQEVIALDADNLKAWQGRGDALRRLERNEAAIIAYNKALQFESNNSKILSKKGWALYEQKAYDQSLSMQEKALEIDPNNASAWSGKGIALIGLQRYEEALTAFNQAQRLKPQEPKIWLNKALALEYLQRPRAVEEVYEEALTAYDDFLRVKPNEPVAWVDRGEVLRKLNRYQDALNSYEEAIEVKPNFHSAWQGKGITHFFRGEYEQALDAYDQALDINPKSYLVWHNRGSLLAEGMNDLEAAIQSFDQALEINPSFYHAWRDKGFALSNLARPQKAIAAFDEALEIQPNDHKSWVGRGIVLTELERYQEALAAVNQAVTIEPNDPLVWVNQGSVLEQMGRREEAITAYEKALELNPRFRPATQGLERLR